MRSTVVPAQITTIEDKIAGNLNFIQVFLLVIPVFCAIVLYVLFLPFMGLAWYKVWLALAVTLVSVGLAVRIKEKLALDWLIVIFRYIARPANYIINKNDLSTHDVVLPVSNENSIKTATQEKPLPVKIISPEPAIGDVAQLEQLISTNKLKLQFKSSKKGGLYVAFTQVQA